MIRLKKYKRNIVVIVVFIIILFSVLYYMWLSLPNGDTPHTRASMGIRISLESQEDSWEVTIENIHYQGESLSSIPYESMHVYIKLNRPSENYSRCYIPLRNIKDTWGEDYNISSSTTANMNRIIWNDLDTDDELSVGDTIIIEKEGGEDWQILPGDEIRIIGTVNSVHCISSATELPNFTEGHVYDPGEMKVYDGIAKVW